MKIWIKVIFSVLFIVSIFTLNLYESSLWENKLRLEMSRETDLILLRFENTVKNRVHVTEYLKSIMMLNPDTTPNEFRFFADRLMKFNPSIRALQYADEETRVIYVFPVKTNEITVEEPMVLIKDPKRGGFVKTAIGEKRLTIQPPFELRQGGLGIVVRNPIFIDDSFRGLAIAVIDVSVIIDDVLRDLDQSEYCLEIKDSNDLVIFDNTEGADYKLYERRTFEVYDSRWHIALCCRNCMKKPPLKNRFAPVLAVFAVLLFTFLIINMLINRSKQLEAEIEKRTFELHENETRFQTVVAKTGAGYFLIDTEGRYRDVNDAWLKMHGYQSKNEIIGKPFSVTQTEEDLAEAGELVRQLTNGVAVPVGELSRLRKDGSKGYHIFTARPVFTGGSITGAEGFIFDITHRIEHEKQKDVLMKEIHHRIKNNLLIVASLLRIKDAAIGDAADLSDIINQIEAIQLLHEHLYRTGNFSGISVEDYLCELLPSIFSTLTSDYVDLIYSIDELYMDMKTAVPVGLILNEIATNAVKYGFSAGRKSWFKGRASSESGQGVLDPDGHKQRRPYSRRSRAKPQRYFRADADLRACGRPAGDPSGEDFSIHRF